MSTIAIALLIFVAVVILIGFYLIWTSDQVGKGLDQ